MLTDIRAQVKLKDRITQEYVMLKVRLFINLNNAKKPENRVGDWFENLPNDIENFTTRMKKLEFDNPFLSEIIKILDENENSYRTLKAYLHVRILLDTHVQFSKCVQNPVYPYDYIKDIKDFSVSLKKLENDNPWLVTIKEILGGDVDITHLENGDSEFKLYIPITIHVGAEDTHGTSSVEFKVMNETMSLTIYKMENDKYYVHNTLYQISDYFKTKTEAINWIIDEVKGELKDE